MIILIFFLKRVFNSTGFNADIGSLAETIVILFSLNSSSLISSVLETPTISLSTIINTE